MSLVGQIFFLKWILYVDFFHVLAILHAITGAENRHSRYLCVLQEENYLFMLFFIIVTHPNPMEFDLGIWVKKPWDRGRPARNSGRAGHTGGV